MRIRGLRLRRDWDKVWTAIQSSTLALTVRKKLLGSFLVMIVLLGVLGWISMSKIASMQLENEKITTSWLFSIETINRINLLAEQMLALQATMIMEPNEDNKKQFMPEAGKLFTAVEANMEQYATKIKTEEEQAYFDTLTKAWRNYKDYYSDAFVLSQRVNFVEGSGTYAGQITKMLTTTQGAYHTMQKQIDLLVKLNHDGALVSTEESKQLYQNALRDTILTLLIAVAAAIGLSIVISNHFANPIGQVSLALQRIADGDLTLNNLQVSNRDEIGQLVTSLNKMSLNLRTLLLQIQDASTHVAASSEQLLESSEKNAKAAEHVTQSVQIVAAGSENQMQSATETSMAMEEMTMGALRIAQSTAEVSELAVETSRQAEAGNNTMQAFVGIMNNISESVRRSGEEMQRLEGHSHEIGMITKLIGDIAKQTVMLALNAAIESARAGEHGRGFAVVSQEVRKLAEQSNVAVKQITDIINKIQNDTQHAAGTMKQGLHAVEQGITAIENVSNSFSNIVQSTENVTDKIQDAASAAQQMAASSQHVSASILEMSSIARRSSSSAKTVAATTDGQLVSVNEIAASAYLLSNVAQDLSDLVGSFKVTAE
ncbi:methyl-accepting chemotaxis protein [Paenibacillus sp. 1_12]|uniref:methyl-accepting chemotaxis protein n=1 Tax=Paenibacillus sp. 1_12 TaxID=1566278 RepID=UPI0008ED0046|nr:methyl-accepting chemotaxis protein [Paenibacillus sp. 1_12]SFL38812.1 methyl-accepting chemotaxis protein [Paenibacillus sp. 1_12]